METLYLINSPVLTAYGGWRFSGPLPLAEAQALAAEGFVSAIGHESTAAWLSALLGCEVPARRATIEMQPGDRALVFRVKGRLPEGALLDAAALDAIPYELGLLVRID